MAAYPSASSMRPRPQSARARVGSHRRLVPLVSLLVEELIAAMEGAPGGDGVAGEELEHPPLPEMHHEEPESKGLHRLQGEAHQPPGLVEGTLHPAVGGAAE
jgi:hypothetical protein